MTYKKVFPLIYNKKTTFAMKKIIAFILLLAVIYTLPGNLHLKKAIQNPLKALQNLNFTKIVSKWGDIKLHR